MVSVSVSVAKTRAIGLELGPQRAIVLDDAVVHHGDPARLVRMRVALGRRAVRRPAGMADARHGRGSDPAPAGRRARSACRPRAGARAARRGPSRSRRCRSRDTRAASAPRGSAARPRGGRGSRRCRTSGGSLPPALSARSRAISRSPRPGFTVCRPRPTASAPAGTSSVITDPAATSAPSPIETGATSAEFEPMKARAPISVRCLKTPS